MIKITLLFLSFFIFISQGFALDPKVERIYGGFLDTIEKKYPINQQEIVLKWVGDKLQEFSRSKKYEDLLPVIQDITSLNNEALYKIWLTNETNQADQKILEIREKKKIESEMLTPDFPNIVRDLLSNPGIQFISTNAKREFIDRWEIQRVWYVNYFPVTQPNSRALSQKNGIIVYDQDDSEYRFIENFRFEDKTPYSQLTERFRSFVTEEHSIGTRSDSIFGYNFLNFRFYEDAYGVYESQLASSGFQDDATLLYRRDDGTYNFVTDYSEYKLVNEDDVFWLPEKHLLLDYLREDAKFQSADISWELARIKTIAENLTRWKSEQESIKAIYNWILNNVEYSPVIDLTDEKIFSGIETFKNNQGVCTGYTKLSSYLFYFAGYDDVEVIKWHVIDARDFPEIGHAWLKIWDLYYDPTFDDPVGGKTTKTFDEYKYFGLPKDIFYANRFDFGDLPKEIETASKSEIQAYIFNYLTDLLPKYSDQIDEYQVFAGIQFRKQHNIAWSTILTPELVASKIWSYNVDNNSFRFSENGTERRISQIRYFTLTSENTQQVLDSIWYDTSDVYLFNWQTESGSREWRLWYDLELK